MNSKFVFQFDRSWGFHLLFTTDMKLLHSQIPNDDGLKTNFYFLEKRSNNNNNIIIIIIIIIIITTTTICIAQVPIFKEHDSNILRGAELVLTLHRCHGGNFFLKMFYD